MPTIMAAPPSSSPLKPLPARQPSAGSFRSLAFARERLPLRAPPLASAAGRHEQHEVSHGVDARHRTRTRAWKKLNAMTAGMATIRPTAVATRRLGDARHDGPGAARLISRQVGERLDDAEHGAQTGR